MLNKKLKTKKIIFIVSFILIAIILTGILVQGFAFLIIIPTIVGSILGGTSAVGGTCNIYTAPAGGSFCEACNNPLQSCTEYRCKSLGQNCQFLETESICISVESDDTNPPQITNCQAKDFRTREDIKLTRTPDGCTFTNPIPEFSSVAIKLETNEFSQCRVSSKLGVEFDEGASDSGWFGDSLFDEEHFFAVSLSDVDEKFLDACNNKEACSLYVRCQDQPGNKMRNDFAIKFKIKPGPDLEPPVITNSVVPSGTSFPSNVKELNFSISVDDGTAGVQCKYSKEVDVEFERMDNSFICNSIKDLEKGGFTCNTKFTNLKNGDDAENKFFVRCKDSSGNVNKESFELSLFGSSQLTIKSASLPSGSLLTKRQSIAVNTNKDARCFFQLNNLDEKAFETTGQINHDTLVTFDRGSNKLSVRCVDESGNVDSRESTATLDNDRNYPIITRVFKQFNQLTIITTEESTCNYNTKTSSFNFGDSQAIEMTGKNSEEHSAQLIPGETYYIICRDTFSNDSPVYSIKT